jgi:hypothetical protein
VDFWITAATTVGSVGAGGLVTWYFSKRYYKRASDDLNVAAKELKEESDKLERFSILMLRAVEELGASGTVELNRDPETGEPIGLQFRKELNFSSNSKVSIGMQGDITEILVSPKVWWSIFVQSARSLFRYLLRPRR